MVIDGFACDGLVLAPEGLEEAALTAQEKGEAPARFSPAQAADPGYFDGAGGVEQALEMGFVGFVVEELKSKLDPCERVPGVVGVEGGGALLPVPLAGSFGERGLIADSHQFGHLRGGLEELQAEEALEPVVVLVRFCRLPAPELGLGEVLFGRAFGAVGKGIVFPFDGAEKRFHLHSGQFVGNYDPSVQDHAVQPAFVDFQGGVLFAARFNLREERAQMLEEGGQVAAGCGPVQFTDFGAGEGTGGVLQAGEVGDVGDLPEQLFAPLILEGEELVLLTVCLGEAFGPAPLFGGPGDEPGVGSEAGNFGDAGMAARRGEGDKDLEPAVVFEGFAGLAFTGLGPAVDLLNSIVQGGVGVPVYIEFAQIQIGVVPVQGLKVVHSFFPL